MGPAAPQGRACPGGRALTGFIVSSIADAWAAQVAIKFPIGAYSVPSLGACVWFWLGDSTNMVYTVQDGATLASGQGDVVDEEGDSEERDGVQHDSPPDTPSSPRGKPRGVGRSPPDIPPHPGAAAPRGWGLTTQPSAPGWGRRGAAPGSPRPPPWGFRSTHITH